MLQQKHRNFKRSSCKNQENDKEEEQLRIRIQNANYSNLKSLIIEII